MRILLTSAAITALVVAVPVVARAQDTEDAEILRQAKEHFRLGNEAYKNGKYPEAIKELKRSYLLKRLPPILVNIARTYDKLKDYDNAIFYFKKYLAEAPPDAKDRPQVKQALADVQAEKTKAEEDARAAEAAAAAPPPQQAEEETPPAPPPAPAPPPPAPVAKPAPRAPEKQAVAEAPPLPKNARRAPEPPPAEAPPPLPPPPAAPPPAPRPRPAPSTMLTADSEWVHLPIDVAPPGLPVDVRVQTPVMKGVKVFLYYREAGQADFTKALMKRHGPEKIARIPASVTSGKSFQYYIEAKDSTGMLLKNSGTQVDPNIVMIEPGAPSQVVASSLVTEAEGGEEAPVVQERPRVEQRRPAAEEKPLELPRHEIRAFTEPQHKGPKGPPGPFFSKLGWIGVGLMGGGAVIAAAGGITSLVFANHYADLVFNDAWSTDPVSGSPNCRAQAGYMGRCYFNDPAFPAGQRDIDYQQKGKLAGMLAPVFFGVGGAIFATGAVLSVLDYVQMHSPEAEKARRKAARRQTAAPAKRAPASPAKAAPPAPEPPAAPPAQHSSIQNLIITPVASPNSVGLGAAFNF